MMAASAVTWASSTARERRLFGLGAVIAEPVDIVFHFLVEAFTALLAEAVRNALPGLRPDQAGLAVIPCADHIHVVSPSDARGQRRRGN